MIATLALNAFVVTLLLGGTALATALLRRRSAAERHWLLAVAVAAALAVPALRAALPEGITVGLPTLTTPVPTASPSTSPLPSAAAVTTSFEMARPVPAKAANPIALLPWLWLAGVGVAASRLLAALVRLRAIARDATPVEDASGVPSATTCAERYDWPRRYGCSTASTHRCSPRGACADRSSSCRGPLCPGRPIASVSCSPTSWRMWRAATGAISCSAKRSAPCTGSTRWPGACAACFALKVNGPATTPCSRSGSRRRSSPTISWPWRGSYVRR